MRRAWLAAMLGLTSCAGDPVEGMSPGSTDGGGAEAGSAEESTGTPLADGEGSSEGSSGTSDAADESSTGTPPPGCGNGTLDPDEICDDGNDDDTDACTHLCTPPACDDGFRSGDESDVDCGGACSPCAIGGTCQDHGDCEDDSVCAEQCRLPTSCGELLDAHPELADGNYTIDLAADDRLDPFEVRCDMTGGGWTRVSFEDFDDEVDDAWSSTDTDVCDGLAAEFLGQFDQDDGVERNFDLLGIDHDEIQIRMVFVAIDSWDGEETRVLVDGDEIWSRECTSSEDDTCGQSESHCGNPQWNDGTVSVNATTDHTDGDATLRIEATLDQGIGDESWGIDDVAVFVR